MDFLERLKEHIESLLYTPPIISIGMYNKDANSIALRPSPSSINHRDMGKGKVYPFNFQMLIHHENNLQAYNIGQKLLEDLEKSSDQVTSSNNSYEVITIRNTTAPNFVEETSYGSLWTLIFEAELYIKGGQ